MHNIHRPLEPREGRGAARGDMIEFGKRKDAGTGYLARSERVGPGVLVLHEFFGLTQAFKDMADDLNAEGFTALAPDLYDGKVAGSVDEAKAMSDALDVDSVMLRLKGAADHLTSNWHPRLGAVGFSLGADFALLLATEREVEAVAVYYGLWGVEPGKWRTPLLGHYADKDSWLERGAVDKVFPALVENGVDAEFHVYPGTGHWFANPDVEGWYDAEAAGLAWGRTVDFLTHHLA